MLLILEMPLALPEGCVGGGLFRVPVGRKQEKRTDFFFFFHKNDLLSAFCLALLSRFSSVASTELEESIGR